MIAIIGPVILGLGATVDVAATQQLIGSLLSRGGPPKVKPGNILKAAVQAKELRERGIQPVVTEDPFTGNLLVGSADQDLFTLAQERAGREAAAATPAEIGEIRRLRDTIIELRAGDITQEQAERRLGLAIARDIDVPTQPRTVDPRFQRQTARQVAPGVVLRGNAFTQRRLGGPCATATTRLQRLRCGRFGFS